MTTSRARTTFLSATLCVTLAAIGSVTLVDPATAASSVPVASVLATGIDDGSFDSMGSYDESNYAAESEALPSALIDALDRDLGITGS
jgi:hypothetical protein